MVVESAENGRLCDGAPVSKHLAVRTPHARAKNSSATFAEPAVVVAVEGRPARNAEGRPEPRFDSAEPAPVRFKRIGGADTVATGVVPLRHVVAGAGWQHHFCVAGGSRGHVTVTVERCRDS